MDGAGGVLELKLKLKLKNHRSILIWVYDVGYIFISRDAEFIPLDLIPYL